MITTSYKILHNSVFNMTSNIKWSTVTKKNDVTASVKINIIYE